MSTQLSPKKSPKRSLQNTFSLLKYFTFIFDWLNHLIVGFAEVFGYRVIKLTLEKWLDLVLFDNYLTFAYFRFSDKSGFSLRDFLILPRKF